MGAIPLLALLEPAAPLRLGVLPPGLSEWPEPLNAVKLLGLLTLRSRRGVWPGFFGCSYTYSYFGELSAGVDCERASAGELSEPSPAPPPPGVALPGRSGVPVAGRAGLRLPLSVLPAPSLAK